MKTQSQRNGSKLIYVFLGLEILLIAVGGAWYFIQQRPVSSEPGPPFEAVAFIGPSPIPSILVTQHSSGRDVLKAPPGKAGQPMEAMVGEAVDQWGDFSSVVGQTELRSPEDPKSKPVVNALRLTQDRGQLRAITFGPGAWMEGIGDATLKPFPLESAPVDPGLTAVQLVRCRVDPGKTLTTLQLSNPASGKSWLTISAHPDGSFESFLTPARNAQKVEAPPNTFATVSVTWDPRPGKNLYRLGVRPVGGLPRMIKESKVEAKGLEPASQMQIGDKEQVRGSMDVLETMVFNRELPTKELTRVEDWIHKHYFSDVVSGGPFAWAASSLTASWGDEESWSGEGIPAANEEAQFGDAPRAEPITIHLDGNRPIKKLTFSNASPSWTIAPGTLPAARINITDGDGTGRERIGAQLLVEDTELNFQVSLEGFTGVPSDDLNCQGDGGTVNFSRSLLTGLNLGSSTTAARGMVYSIDAPDLIKTHFSAGFHDHPASVEGNSAVSTFVRVNQSQKTWASPVRVGGGGGSEYGVLTIQNKATWDQDRGAIYIGHSGPDGVGRRSNGRIEVGHPSSSGNLTIGIDVALKIGDLGGKGVVDVNNGTLTVKASKDTQTVWIGDRGSDQAKGGGDGTLNLNPGGTLLTARGFSRNAGTASGSGKFNFNGGLLRITRATGNVTKDLIGPGITVTLEGAGARIDTNTHSTILARDLAGPGGLEKLGQGSLTLTGKNSFKGDTKVTTGVLALSGPALPANGTLHLNGGQAQLNSPITTAKLAFSGVPQTAGTWGATGSGATHIDDARFRGPGVLTVSVE